MNDDTTMTVLRLQLSRDLDRIARNFKGPVKLTLMVRHPEVPDHSRDVVMSNDTDEAALADLLRWNFAGLPKEPRDDA